MDKSGLVELICKLNSSKTVESSCEQLCQEVKAVLTSLNTCSEEIKTTLKPILNTELDLESTELDYICLNFYILHLINLKLDESELELLSVQQSKQLKQCFQTIISLGICKNLQPNLPYYINLPQFSKDILHNYNLLKTTIIAFNAFMKFLNLRLIILPETLKYILVGIYQIAFCPLKKPSDQKDSFSMTQELYDQFMTEKVLFKNILEELNTGIHPAIYIKETMKIFAENSPVWFKKALSQQLTILIKSKGGVINVSVAMIDGSCNDSTKTWKTLDLITKLILSCKSSPDFKENVAEQVCNLLDKVKEDNLIFERIFINCAKQLKLTDFDLSKDVFLKRVMNFFFCFTHPHQFVEEDLTDKLKQNVRLLNELFIVNTADNPGFPLSCLKPIINVLFRMYSVLSENCFEATRKELSQLIIEPLKVCDNFFTVMDMLLFNLPSEEMASFRSDAILTVRLDKVVIKHSQQAVNYSSEENVEIILALFGKETNLRAKLFAYLLNCLAEKEKYFKKADESLLEAEEVFMNEFIERKLTVYKALSELAEDKAVGRHVAADPEFMVKYLEDVLRKTLQTGLHKAEDCDNEHYQVVFTVMMILQSLVENSKAGLDKYKKLSGLLRRIRTECANAELKSLADRVIEVVDGEKIPEQAEEKLSELDKIIEDVCDPLLPVRGHGLMTLAKLVESKSNEVMARKQFILNIFQQNLKDKDSFIYLNAIGGLAAMADVFPDTVINVLCEEFSDFDRADEGHEVRMKLGEVLVRTTKILGDMAPKYKSVLINTFLVGSKDDDHLIRASSLSNLGEICRVLGYKLGSIITEVLVCVHAVISTDKAVEARRAAVTVMRQLFVGLDSEMIAFLKDDILPIYRTLKRIYSGDKDDVMRLQAQLALEELNENVKSFVFPKPQLDSDKKIILL